MSDWKVELLTIAGVVAVVVAHYAGYDLKPEVVAAILGPQTVSMIGKMFTIGATDGGQTEEGGSGEA